MFVLWQGGCADEGPVQDGRARPPAKVLLHARGDTQGRLASFSREETAAFCRWGPEWGLESQVCGCFHSSRLALRKAASQNAWSGRLPLEQRFRPSGDGTGRAPHSGPHLRKTSSMHERGSPFHARVLSQGGRGRQACGTCERRPVQGLTLFPASGIISLTVFEARRYLSWIEGLTTNQYVGGSNPSRRTI